MLWYHYALFVIFILMIISPAWFFRKIEKFLFDENIENPLSIENYVSPCNITSKYNYAGEQEDIMRDEKVLNNLDMMIKKSRKRDVKKLWKIKRAEFLRDMHWRKHSAKINKG